jgi:hypothetical protein
MLTTQGDGAKELLTAMGGVNMGQVWKAVRVLGFDKVELVSHGQTQAYEDNCGLGAPKGVAKAFRLYVKPGSLPTFFRETSLNKSACSGDGAWLKNAGLGGQTIEEDTVGFTRVK